jgi:hypothetical protein
MAFRATLAVAKRRPKVFPEGSEAPLKFLAARKRLAWFGVDALLPSVHPKYKDGEQDVNKLSVKERVWHPPMISSRKINVLRKIAKVEGTYGSFDPETLRGWDPQWDVALALQRTRGTGRYMTLRKPKLASRHRTREERAQKIEAAMVGMDERMEAMQAERIEKKKEPDSIMVKWKKLTSGSRKR